MFEVKKDYSLEDFTRGVRKYPFNEMEVGDYFSVPKVRAGRVRAAASHYGERHGMKFSTKSFDDRCVVMRIA